MREGSVIKLSVSRFLKTAIYYSISEKEMLPFYNGILAKIRLATLTDHIADEEIGAVSERRGAPKLQDARKFYLHHLLSTNVDFILKCRLKTCFQFFLHEGLINEKRFIFALHCFTCIVSHRRSIFDRNDSTEHEFKKINHKWNTLITMWDSFIKYVIIVPMYEIHFGE